MCYSGRKSGEIGQRNFMVVYQLLSVAVATDFLMT